MSIELNFCARNFRIVQNVKLPNGYIFVLSFKHCVICRIVTKAMVFMALVRKIVFLKGCVTLEGVACVQLSGQFPHL